MCVPLCYYVCMMRMRVPAHACTQDRTHIAPREWTINSESPNPRAQPGQSPTLPYKQKWHTFVANTAKMFEGANRL